MEPTCYLVSELLPLDLLEKALPPPGSEAPVRQLKQEVSSEFQMFCWTSAFANWKPSTNQVQIVQSRGSRGFRLVGAAALSFPASQIFIHCHIFPAEFSLVATFKAPRLTQKVKEETLLHDEWVVIRDDQKPID